MLFQVRFTDNPERLSIRRQYLPAHLEWLEANRATVLVAGSLRQAEDGGPVGALWIVEAPDKASAERLFETDPFWVQGLRQGYEILHWSKAFPERRVPV
jgi:uncharacterized protein YciI